MPNLQLPVRTIDDATAYRDRILAVIPAGKQFEPPMTLYLTDNTSPEDIIAAKAAQFVNQFYQVCCNIAICSTTALPISSEAVAAGEGALQT